MLLALTSLWYLAGASFENCQTDVWEPNDTVQQATPLQLGETLFSLNLCPSSAGNHDVDIFALPASASPLFISLDFGEVLQHDIVVESLYKENGDEVVARRVFGASNGGAGVRRHTMTVAGADYLRVRHDGGNPFFDEVTEKLFVATRYPLGSYAITANESPFSCRLSSNTVEADDVFPSGLYSTDAGDALAVATLFSDQDVLSTDGRYTTVTRSQDDAALLGHFCGRVHSNFYRFPSLPAGHVSTLRTVPAVHDGLAIWVEPVDEAGASLATPTLVDIASNSTAAVGPLVFSVPSSPILRFFRSGSTTDPTATPPDAATDFVVLFGFQACNPLAEADEPNDSVATAAPLVAFATPVETGLCGAGDRDWFILGANHTGLMQLVATVDNNDPVARTVDVSFVVHALTDSRDAVDATAEAPLTAAGGGFPVVAGRSYAIETFSKYGDVRYSVALEEFFCFPDIVLDDDVANMEQAPFIGAEEEVKGSFCPSEDAEIVERADTHYFPVDMATGSNLRLLDLTFTSSPSNPLYLDESPLLALDVLDENSTVILGPIYNNDTVPPVLIVEGEGKLVIRVRRLDADPTLPVAYSFSTSYLAPCVSLRPTTVPTELSLNAATPIVGSTFSGSHCPVDDVNLFSFEVASAGLVNVTVEAPASDVAVVSYNALNRHTTSFSPVSDGTPFPVPVSAGTNYLSVLVAPGLPDLFDYQVTLSDVYCPEGEGHYRLADAVDIGHMDVVSGRFCSSHDHASTAQFLRVPLGAPALLKVETQPTFTQNGKYVVDLVAFRDDEVDVNEVNPTPTRVVARLVESFDVGSIFQAEATYGYRYVYEVPPAGETYYLRITDVTENPIPLEFSIVLTLDSLDACEPSYGRVNAWPDFGTQFDDAVDKLPYLPLYGTVGTIEGSLCGSQASYLIHVHEPSILKVSAKFEGVDLAEQNMRVNMAVYAVWKNVDGGRPNRAASRLDVYSLSFADDDDVWLEFNSTTNSYASEELVVSASPGLYIVTLDETNDKDVQWYELRVEVEERGCFPKADLYVETGTAPLAVFEEDDEVFYLIHNDYDGSFCPSVGNGTIYYGFPQSVGETAYYVEVIAADVKDPYSDNAKAVYVAQLVGADGTPFPFDYAGAAAYGVSHRPGPFDPAGAVVFELDVSGWFPATPVHQQEGAFLAVSRTAYTSPWVSNDNTEYFDSLKDAKAIPHAERASAKMEVVMDFNPCGGDYLEPNDGFNADTYPGLLSAPVIDESVLFPAGGAATTHRFPGLTLCPAGDRDVMVVRVPSATAGTFNGRILLITLIGREFEGVPCTDDSPCVNGDYCGPDSYCTSNDTQYDQYIGERHFGLEVLYTQSFSRPEWPVFNFRLRPGDRVTVPVWVTSSFSFGTWTSYETKASPYDMELTALADGACSMAEARAAAPAGSTFLTTELMATRQPGTTYVDGSDGEDYHDLSDLFTDFPLGYTGGLLCPTVDTGRWYVNKVSSTRVVRYFVRPADQTRAGALRVSLYTQVGEGGSRVEVNASDVPAPAGVDAALVEAGLIGSVSLDSTEWLLLHVEQANPSDPAPVSYTVYLEDEQALSSRDCVPDRYEPNGNGLAPFMLSGSIGEATPSRTWTDMSLCSAGVQADVLSAFEFVVDEYVTNLTVTVTVVDGTDNFMPNVYLRRVEQSFDAAPYDDEVDGSSFTAYTIEYALPGSYLVVIEGAGGDVLNNYSLTVAADGFHGLYVADTPLQSSVPRTPATCGNGVLDAGEVCDPTAVDLIPGTQSCCSHRCDGYRVAGTKCFTPAAELGCAEEVRCDGLSAECPAPTGVKEAGVLCAAATNCRSSAVCDGVSMVCPASEVRVNATCSVDLSAYFALGGPCDASDEGTCAEDGSCVPDDVSCICDSEDEPCFLDFNPCTLEGCSSSGDECVLTGFADEGTECSIATRTGAVDGTCDGAGTCVAGEAVACPDDCTSPWHGTCVAGVCLCNPLQKGEACAEYAGPTTVTTDDDRSFEVLSAPCEVRFDAGVYTSVAGGRAARVESSCGVVAMVHLDGATADEAGATIRFDPTNGAGVDVPGAPLHHAGAFNAGEGVVMLFAASASVGDEGLAGLDVTDAVEVVLTSVLVEAPGGRVDAEAYVGVLNVHDEEDVVTPAAPQRLQTSRARFSGATALPVATHVLVYHNGSTAAADEYFSLKSVTVQLVRLGEGRSLTDDPLALDRVATTDEDEDEMDGEGEGEGEGDGDGQDVGADDDDAGGNGGAMSADASSADSEGLSGGAIAGIVVGVLIAVALVVAAIFVLVTRRAASAGTGATSTTEMNTMSSPDAETADLEETKADADADADAATDVDADADGKEEKKEDV